MPVPSNQTAATAIDIGTLTGYTPYATTQDAWDGAATVTDLWYSYLPVVGDTGLEIYGQGNGSTYIPHSTIWTGPIAGIAELSNSHDSQSKPVQQDIVTFVVVGERVFIRFRKQGGGSNNPSILTIRIARWQNELIADGDLFINDSSPGYPGIAMERATAAPKRYHVNYPAGEGQQTLRNGIVGVIDAFDVDGVVLYDVAATGLTVRATPTMPDANYIDAIGTNQIDTFWALKIFGPGHNFAVSIDENGTVGSPLDLGSASITDIQPQADNSILYCLKGSEIVTVTNPGGVQASFLTVDAGFNFTPNLLMMTDDTLLVGYEKAATAPYIKQFDLSGTLLSTTTLDISIGTLIERIFADPEDPDFFWVWWQTSTLNRFQRYAVGNGTPVEDLSRLKFIESVSQTAALTGETVYSGADFSCVPIVLRIPVPPATAIRLTQLPLEIAYDYGLLQPFVEGEGLNWIRPPRT